jgi:hypothetical protein
MLVFSWEQDLANNICSRTLVTRNYLAFKINGKNRRIFNEGKRHSQ